MKTIHELLILSVLAVATPVIHKQAVYWAELGREQAVVDNVNQELTQVYELQKGMK